MGLVFNRKTASGATINKRFRADKDLHKKDIKKISHQVSIYKKGGKVRLKEMMMHDQKGVLTREEVKKEIQDLIGEKFITSKAQARKVGKELGLKGKRTFLKFDSLAKHNQKLRINEVKNNGSHSKGEGSRQSQFSVNNRKEVHKDYRAVENKIKEDSIAPITRSSAMNNLPKPNINLSSKNYSQNIGDNNNIVSGKIEDNLEKKTIYDLIREKNHEQ